MASSDEADELDEIYLGAVAVCEGGEGKVKNGGHDDAVSETIVGRKSRAVEVERITEPVAVEKLVVRERRVLDSDGAIEKLDGPPRRLRDVIHFRKGDAEGTKRSIAELMRERRGEKCRFEKRPRLPNLKVQKYLDPNTKQNVLQGAFAFEDNRFSKMRIYDADIPYSTFEIRMEDAKIIQLCELKDRIMDLKSRLITDYVIFGCVVGKSQKKVSKNGGQYVVFTLCDMRGSTQTTINLILWNDAFKAFHMEQPGVVFCLREPAILDPRDNEKMRVTEGKEYIHSGYALSVKSSKSIARIGRCSDFGICKMERKNGRPCGEWTNMKFGDTCKFHRSEREERIHKSSRQFVNGVERPKPRSMNLKKGVETKDLSNDSTDQQAKGQKTRWRSRGDAIKEHDNNRLKKLKKMNKNRSTTPRGFVETGKIVKARQALKEMPLVSKFSPPIAEAMVTLLQHGFTLDEDGRLLPPPQYG